MSYQPDGWVIIKIALQDSEVFYKVFASWSGSYMAGNHWRMNSGITRVVDKGDRYLIYGESGSCYDCGKEAEGRLTLYNQSVLDQYLLKYPTELSVVSVEDLLKDFP